MSDQIDQIETEEVQGRRGRCVPVQQGCAQTQYQDWRQQSSCYQPQTNACQQFGQPQICGSDGRSYQPQQQGAQCGSDRGVARGAGGAASSGGDAPGSWEDNFRVTHTKNQLDHWGATKDGNVVRDKSGKVIDADYGNGNWAHQSHDSNSVTVHRGGKTEHWVEQPDGHWMDQMNNRHIAKEALQYDGRTGKLVIEGETFDPNKKAQGPEGPDAPPPVDGGGEKPPEVKPPVEKEKPPAEKPPEAKKITAQELVDELVKNPDVEKLHGLMANMTGAERIGMMRDITRFTDSTAKQNPQDALAQQVAIKAHALMGRELLPEMLKSGWNSNQLKGLMAGMEGPERFAAMGYAVALSDQILSSKKAPADMTGLTPEQIGAGARGSMGFMCADLAREYEQEATTTKDTARAAKCKDIAGLSKWRSVEWLMSAGDLEPKLYSDPSHEAFRKGVQNINLPGNAADFILEQGKTNPKWFYPSPDEVKANPKNAYQDSYERGRQAIYAKMKEPKVIKPAAVEVLEPRR